MVPEKHSKKSQTLIEKHLYNEHLLQRTGFLGPCEKFKPNMPLYSDTPYFLCDDKNKLLFDFQVFLFDTLLYFYILWVTYLSKGFLSKVFTLEST